MRAFEHTSSRASEIIENEAVGAFITHHRSGSGSPLADTPSLLANGGDIFKMLGYLEENRLSGYVLYE